MCNLVWECVSSAGLIFIYTWMHEVDLNVKVIYRTNVKLFFILSRTSRIFRL